MRSTVFQIKSGGWISLPYIVHRIRDFLSTFSLLFVCNCLPKGTLDCSFIYLVANAIVHVGKTPNSNSNSNWQLHLHWSHIHTKSTTMGHYNCLPCDVNLIDFFFLSFHLCFINLLLLLLQIIRVDLSVVDFSRNKIKITVTRDLPT